VGTGCQELVSYYIIVVKSDHPTCVACAQGLGFKLDKKFVANPSIPVGSLLSAGISDIWPEFFNGRTVTFTVYAYNQDNLLLAESTAPVRWATGGKSCREAGINTYKAFQSWNLFENLIEVGFYNPGGGNLSGYEIFGNQIYGPYTVQDNEKWKDYFTDSIHWRNKDFLFNGAREGNTLLPKGGTARPWCDAPVPGYASWDLTPNWNYFMSIGAKNAGYKVTVKNQCIFGGAGGGNYYVGE
jgi:hypothetical protein